MATFRFKQFTVDDHGCGMKICTDSVLLGAWADIDNAASIIDLGAGSGLLALMCAQRNACASVLAIEIDLSASKAAETNFAASPWAERLQTMHGDAATITPAIKPDLIICNPPYFTSGLQSPDEHRALARHAASLSPATAIEIAAEWLSDKGSLAMVTPADCRQAVTLHAEMNRMKIRRICMVSTSTRKAPTRILWQISRTDGPIESSTLSIRDAQGAFSDSYTSLTSAFYL